MIPFKKKFADILVSSKLYCRDKILTISQGAKKVTNLVLSINIDWIFVLLASYFFVYPYSFWERLAFSIGITGVYHIVKIHITQILIILRKDK